jgi:N-acetylneuraminic acid mutarotase
MKHLYTLILILVVNLLSAQNGWNQLEGIPGGSRHHPICFSIDNSGYVLCGNANPAETQLPYLNDFYTYNADDATWTKLADFPGTARGFGVGLSYEGKGYAGFGYGDNDYLNDMWEYDPQTNEWEKLPDCPCDGRTHPAFVAAKGKIYVGLGGTGQNAGDWWSYDIDNKSWTQEEDFPAEKRHHPYYFTVDDEPYVGFGHSSQPTVIHNDFYKFDVESGTWEKMNDFPSHGRVAGTHFTVGNKGYILAGDGGDHGYDEGELWEYDPNLDEWEQLPTFPADGRWAPGSFVVNGTAYFTSGFARNTRVYHNDLWAFQIQVSTPVVEQSSVSTHKVYPSPARESVSIEGLNIGTTYQLIDNKGNIHRTIQFSNETSEIIIETLPKGIYWLVGSEVSEKAIPIVVQ